MTKGSVQKTQEEFVYNIFVRGLFAFVPCSQFRDGGTSACVCNVEKQL